MRYRFWFKTEEEAKIEAWRQLQYGWAVQIKFDEDKREGCLATGKRVLIG